jgi:hypothetical protein
VAERSCRLGERLTAADSSVRRAEVGLGRFAQPGAAPGPRGPDSHRGGRGLGGRQPLGRAGVRASVLAPWLTPAGSSLTRDGLNASLQPEPREIRIARLVLIYPALFHSLDLLDQGEDGMFISKPVTTWFMQAYLPDTDIVALSKTDRRLAPMIAGLHGLPPTTCVPACLPAAQATDLSCPASSPPGR